MACCEKNFSSCFTDSAVHYFIILIRNGSRIIVTEMLSTHDERMRGSLDFPNHINLNDITGDFQVQLELYGMVTKHFLPCSNIASILEFFK